MSVETQRDSPRPANAGPARWRLHGLTWSHFLNDGAANYLPGVLPAVLVSFHEPVRMAGVLVAALSIGQTLQPFTGWVADRMGSRYFVVIGLLLSTVGGGLLGVVHSTTLLIVILVLIGLGSAFFHPPALAAIRGDAGDRKGLLTSVFLVGGELGRGLWPTLASLVVVTFGIGRLWVLGMPGLATLPVLYWLAPKLPPRHDHRPRLRLRAHARPMAALIGYRSVRALTSFGLATFIPVLWHLRGRSLVGGASVITTILGVGVLGNLWGGHLADRVGRRPLLVGSAAITSALVLPVVYVRGPWTWAIAAVLGIGMFLAASTTILIGQDIFPENRSMGSGIALGFANGIGALLVLLIGLAINDSNVIVVFWVLAGLGAASLLACWALPDELMR